MATNYFTLFGGITFFLKEFNLISLKIVFEFFFNFANCLKVFVYDLYYLTPCFNFFNYFAFFCQLIKISITSSPIFDPFTLRHIHVITNLRLTGSRMVGSNCCYFLTLLLFCTNFLFQTKTTTTTIND